MQHGVGRRRDTRKVMVDPRLSGASVCQPATAAPEQKAEPVVKAMRDGIVARRGKDARNIANVARA